MAPTRTPAITSTADEAGRLRRTSDGSAAAALRARTAPAHETVDAAFAGFDLGEAHAYRDFLTAHARALPAAEAVLARAPGLPRWRSRTPLLRDDLAALGTAMPPPLALDLAASPAAAWGALYVVEGSRLGGTLLARQVGAGLPRAYLGAQHEAGEWRALREAIDAEAAQHDDAWLDAATAAAAACFALYGRAAAIR